MARLGQFACVCPHLCASRCASLQLPSFGAQNTVKRHAKAACVPVNSTHAEYAASAAAWIWARDVLAGEDAVKAAGERYLPRLDSQSEKEEYERTTVNGLFLRRANQPLEEFTPFPNFAAGCT